MSEGMEVVTGGTDNHLLLLDVHKSFGLTGRQAESAIRECHMTLNRNALPFDANGPWYTSGLRVGTPAATTLGMTPADMKEVAKVFKLVLSNTKPQIVQKGAEAGQPSRARYQVAKAAAETARERIAALLDRYPVYPEIDLELLRSAAREWEGAERPTAAAAR
jgi:glycine hydroxymethyltransferase